MMRRNHGKAVALLCGILLVLFADVIFFGNNFYFRDLTTFYYPTKQIIRETILGGEFPYWNRYYSAGQPMAANPEYEIFYPPQWLILLPDYHLGYRLHIVIHFFIAAIGMFALLRSLRAATVAAFWGALTFALSGAFLSYVNLLPILFAMTWIPFILLFTRRAVLRWSVRDAALASLFFSLQMLVGEPTTIAQTGVLMGLVAIAQGWQQVPRGPAAIRSLLTVSAIGLAALMAGAVQIIPAIDHAGDSVRARGFPYEVVTMMSMPPIRPLELIYPNLLGPLSENAGLYWGAELYPAAESPFILSVYFGLLGAVLVISGVTMRYRGYLFVLAVCSISYILALGGHTPFFRGLYAAGLHSVRYPEKFALMALVVLVVFAAAVFDRLAAGDETIRRIAVRVSLVVASVALILGLFGFTPAYVDLFVRFWGVEADAAAPIMARISARDWLIAAARGGIVAVLIAARTRLRKMTWCSLIMVFVIADLGAQANRILLRIPRKLFTAPPVEAALAADRQRFRIFHEPQWQQSSAEWRGYAFKAGADVYWLFRNGLFPMTTANSRLQTVLEWDIDATNLLATTDLVTALQAIVASGHSDAVERILAMSNVGYRAVLRPLAEVREGLESDIENVTPVRLIRYAGQERYYFAEELVQIDTLREFVDGILSPDRVTKTAFVRFPSFAPAAGAVLRVEETANSAIVEVECKGTGFLVAAVTPHKYWRATVDGNPATLHQANIGYQGVIVPPGRHLITMRYRNTIIPVALSVSSVTILLLVFLVLQRRVVAPSSPGRAESEGGERHATSGTSRGPDQRGNRGS